MKNHKRQMLALLFLALAFILGGFFAAASSVRNVFAGILLSGVGGAFALAALIPVSLSIREQERRKDDRLKRLEEEVELLKKGDAHK